MFNKFRQKARHFLHVSGLRNYYFWEGVYTSAVEVPLKKPGFESNIIEERNYAYAKSLLERNNLAFIPHESSGDDTLLPLIVSLLSKSNDDFNILDFGGGPGLSLYHLSKCLVKKISIRYTIVETKKMCEFSRELFKNNPDIEYVDAVPESIPNLKIVYISSVLQYIEDYKNLLRKLTNLNPAYVFLAKTSCGEFDTYVSKQLNESGCELSYRFLNIHEIIEIMNEFGYKLIFKSSHGNTYDQRNFPEKLRMNKASNLLFEKE